MIVTYFYLILGHIQCNNIILKYYRTNLQPPSTWLFQMLFNSFPLLGSQYPPPYIPLPILQLRNGFISLFSFLFSVTRLFSVVVFFSVQGLQWLLLFPKHIILLRPNQNICSKLRFIFPQVLCLHLDNLIVAYPRLDVQSHYPLIIFSKLPRLQLTSLPLLFFFIQFDDICIYCAQQSEFLFGWNISRQFSIYLSFLVTFH